MSRASTSIPRQAVWFVVTRGISGLGSSLTAFCLDVWVYRQTGSYAMFVYLALIGMLPNIVLAPVIGALTDRCDKCRLLLACEALPTLALSWVLWRVSEHALGVVDVAGAILMLALASTGRWMATGVTISILVPPEGRGRINGLQQSFFGMSSVLGPMLGVAGLEAIGLEGVLAVDILAKLVAAAALLAIRASGLGGAEDPRRGEGTFLSEMLFGLKWVFRHAGLSRLMLFFMFFNLGAGVFNVAFAPYLLASVGNRVLAWGLASHGAGVFLCGLALARWKGPGAPEWRVLGGALSFGAVMAVWGMSRSPEAIALLAFCAGALMSLILASSQTIWQAHVPAEIQGKVFAARMMVSFSLGPVAILVSLPFSTYVIAPLLQALPWLGRMWGAGQGGALGLMVSALGLMVMLQCLALWLRGGLAMGHEGPAEAALGPKPGALGELSKQNNGD
ncbi:MFS transporter [Chromobacterium vaccinii]|uniref:MFS transporter n=1 Tax=Chromobacterium vaccinii TaxID=1108595 RepID=UPI001E5B7658|nr:MFS transporter [Chromobacterium vaccinii]MCD4502397.1 MFS transporter [Chromobacterium vaccinii]